MHLPLAFSIHHFISSVGADAGFAAIIGLAILVLLYFAQARETTTLRDEAISASQRVEQLERRVAAMGPLPVAPPPGAAPNQAAADEQPDGVAATAAGARPGGARPLATPAASAAVPDSPSPPARRPAIPAAPAGVGAPALTTATRLIPIPTAEVGEQPSAEPAGEPAAAQESPDDERPPAAAQPEVPQRAQGAEPAGATALATPPPATAAAGAGQPPTAGAGQPPTAGAGQPATGGGGPQPPVDAAAGRPATVAAGQPATAGGGQPPPVAANGSGEPQQASARAADGSKSLPPRLQLRPEAAGMPAPLSGGVRTRRARWIPVLVGVLLVAGIVAVLLVVTSTGSSSHHAAGTSSTNAPSAASGSHSAFVASSVTVSVLNGTNVSQLAHRVAQKLARSGYRQGAVATAADQTHTSTVVAFLPGFRSDASHVAASLSLPASAVQQADQSARALACPPPAACRANVIVTVGSDLTNSK